MSARPLPGAGTTGALALALAACLASLPTASAFASVQDGGSPHDALAGAAADVGFPPEAVAALQAAVRQPDIDDFEAVPVDGGEDRLAATRTFRAWHHCDRVPPDDDGTAFQEAATYVRQQRDIAANLSLVDPEAAMRALGRALHALQDCFSHTNAVDLPGPAQAALLAALLEGGAAPDGLRLCGTQPDATEIGLPPGDAYPHDLHNKDAPASSPESAARLPDGRTKHDAAFALAREATLALLRQVLDRLDPDAKAALLDVRIAEGGREKALDLPLPGLLPLLAVAAAAALARRR